MSKQVDERVVSMQFDNQRFERNIHTSMSSIDKLKQKLSFKGASKGLEDVDKATKKVDMNGLGRGVETVRTKFSALQVMGVTALANITNSAVNCGKRMAKALTIDPVKTGLQEYETQMNAVQTILANTQSKGSTLKDVNEALDTLNTYADKTIYNFTEMTRNIGTFTAAGVDLQTSVDSIQGIANLAAVSGSNSQQASTAMYQLSQALAAGKVQLMDWNSVVNAGMGGEMFQNALKETSKLLGTGAEAAIKAKGSFRESLREGWLTSEVLTETLKKFTTTGANERVAEYTGLSKKAVEVALESAKAQYGEADAIEQASKALAEKSGKNANEIKEVLQFAKNAEDAATEVKTFSQLWDTMKESAQSGWAQTWKLIIGDFEQAKALLKPIADFFTGDDGIITKMSNARNKLIESALGRTFASSFKGINKVLDTTKEGLDKVTKPVKTASAALEDLGKIVDKVIIGDFGNGKDRVNALTEAGHNYYRVQNKVNETLGNSFRYSKKQIEEQDKLLGKQTKSTEKTKEQTDETVKLTKKEKDRLIGLTKMSEEQLRSADYSDKQIASIKNLCDQADKLGLSVDEFINGMDEINGRWLLINSFKNIGQSLVDIFKAMGKAWNEIFPPVTADNLFNLIGGFHKLTSNLKINKKKANELKRTFKGVFAIIDMLATITGGALKFGFEIFSQILGVFNMDFLGFTAMLGDGLVGIRNMVKATLDFTKVFEKIAPSLKTAGEKFKSWIETLKNSDNIPRDFVLGFVKGLGEGVKLVGSAIWAFGTGIIEKFREVLGIHSPSKETKEDGKNFVQGFIEGIKEFASEAWEVIKGFGSKCLEFFRNIDWGAILAGGISVGILLILNKVANALTVFEGLGDMFEGLGDMFEDLGKGFKNLGKAAKTWAMSKLILSFAIAIGVLAASIVALSFIKPAKIWIAVGAIAALMALLTGLAILVGKFGPKESMDMVKLAGSLIVLSGAILVIALAAKFLDGTSIYGLGAVIGIMIMIMAIIRVSENISQDADKVGKALFKMAAAMLILALVVKILGGMEVDALKQGVIAVAVLGVIMAGLIAATNLFGKNADNVGKVIFKMAAAILILVLVAKMLGSMDPEQFKQGAKCIVVLSIIIAGLMLVTKIAAGNDLTKLGSTLLAISGAIFLLGGTVAMLGMLKPGHIAKGLVAVTLLSVVISGLVFMLRTVTGNSLKRVGTTLLMMSISIVIMAAAVTLLGFLKISHLAKGLVAVGLLASFMAGMIYATKDAQDCKGNLIVMTVAIGIMTAALIALSFVDPTKLAGATAALGIVMGMFALIIKSASNMKSAIGSLIVMTLAIGVLAGAIYFLSGLPIANAIAAAASLSILLLAMSAALLIISKAKTISPMALVGVGVMTLVIAALAGVLYLLAGLPIANTLVAVTALTTLLLAMSGALVILGVVGMFGAGAFIGIAALAVLIVAIGALIVGIGALTKKFPQLEEFLNTGIPILEKIGYAIGSFFGNIAGGFMSGATSGLPAMGEHLTSFMNNIQGFIDGAKKIDPSSMEGISALAKAVMLITAANFLESITSFLTGGSSFEKFSVQLGFLAEGLNNFSNKLGNFDESKISMVTAAAKAVKILATAASSIPNSGGLLGKLVGENDPDVFASKLPALGEGITKFVDSISGLDESKVTMAKGAATVIKVLAKAADEIPNTGGFISKIVGDNDIGDFASKLPALGKGISDFVDSVSGLDESKVETAKLAAKVITVLAKAADEIPNTGGFISKIVGDNDIGDFAEKLPALGKGITGFLNNLGDFDESKLETAKLAAKVITVLAKAADAIPNTGGFISKIVGDNDIGDFSEKLPALGEGITGFIGNLGDFDETKVETAKLAADIIKTLAAVGEEIPNTGGALALIVGDNDLGDFAEKMPILGEGIQAFAESVGTLSDGQVTSINCACKAIKSFANTAKTLDGGVDTSSIKDLGKVLPKLGENIGKYAGNLTDVDMSVVTASIPAIKSLASMVKNMSGIDHKGAVGLKKSINALADSNVSGFISAFDGQAGKLTSVGNSMTSAIAKGLKTKSSSVTSASKTLVTNISKVFENNNGDFKDLGKTLVTKIAEGMKNKKSEVSSAAKTVASDAKTATRGYYDSFYSAGQYLASGLKAGIKSKAASIAESARSMVKTAVDAAKEEAKINSPSKVFIKIGSSIPEGFAMGIGKLGNAVKASAVDMTDTAINGVKKSIVRLADVVNSDIDAQPTIRPVMDLSNVKSGVNAIGSMLSGNRTLSVNTQAVGAVASSMSRRQNGGDSAGVVSAIKGLRKDIANMPRNTYTINGVTYDDGSNITSAVEALVRGALIERRV